MHALFQSFTVPVSVSSVSLTYDMFVNDWSGAGPIINGGSTLTTPNQHARVDILHNWAAAFDISGGVLHNFYAGVNPGGSPHGYIHYAWDLTPYVTAGGTYKLRFAEADSSGYLNLGVDNVRIVAQSAPATPVPDGGGTLALLGSALLGFAGVRRPAV